MLGCTVQCDPLAADFTTQYAVAKECGWVC